MQQLAALTQTAAFAVFLGTLPLLGTILWSLLGNNRQFDQVNKRLDRIDGRLDRIEDRMVRLESNVSDIRERLAIVETKIEGSPLIRHP